MLSLFHCSFKDYSHIWSALASGWVHWEYPTMWNTDLHFHASPTNGYISVHYLHYTVYSTLFTLYCLQSWMILYKMLHMGRIISLTSSVYRFDIHFCFIDFMIWFTDFMLFLSLYIGYSHDTLPTLTYGKDHFTSIIHVWIQPIFLLHWLDNTLQWLYANFQSLYWLRAWYFANTYIWAGSFQ